MHREVPDACPGPAPSLDIGRVIDRLVDLDALVAVAVISKFHFVRTFRWAAGQTPHRYLTPLRMRRGRNCRTSPA